MSRFTLVLPAFAAAFVVFGISAGATPTVPDPEFASFLVRFEDGTRRFMNGDPGPWKDNVSRRDDTMIMGAWGAYEKGWADASARYDWAAARFRDSGASLRVEYLATTVAGDIAYTTAIERAEVRIAGQDKPAPMALRVTHIFRKENSQWKLVLRHADPLIAKTAPATVLQR